MRFAALLFASFVPLLSFADRIDSVVARDMRNFDIPGACIGVVKDGKVIRKQAFGLADLELQVPMKPDDVFEIGSMTKQFTAALALMLVEDGKIGLDDPVSKYVPEAPATWVDVTIRRMLNQDSGLPEYAFVPGIGLMDTFDRATWMKKIDELPLDFPPGTAWAYSNTNYALLGWAIEKATGKPYADFLADRILKPLGMSHTRIEDVNAIIPRRAHGYLPQPGQPLARVEGGKSSIQSDGALLSNIEDLAKWDAALVARKLLKPESYALLWRAVTLNSGRTYPYGMGWFLQAPGMVPVVYHPGADVGYSSCITRFLDNGLTVIVLANTYGVYPEAMARHIAEAVDPTVRPHVPLAIADPDPERTKAIRAVLDELGAGKPDAATMEIDFLGTLHTSRTKAFPQYGDLVKIASLDFAGATPRGDDTLLAYRLRNDKRTLTTYILWSRANRLAQLYFRPDPIS